MSDFDRSSTKETMPITFEKLDLNHDGVVTKDEFEKVMSGGKADWVQKREAAARDYLEEHGLVGFMQFLMQSLMKDKPADPYLFLQKQVAMRAAQVRVEAGAQPTALQTLLSNLDTSSPTVSEEQLAVLERRRTKRGIGCGRTMRNSGVLQQTLRWSTTDYYRRVSR